MQQVKNMKAGPRLTDGYKSAGVIFDVRRSCLNFICRKARYEPLPRTSDPPRYCSANDCTIVSESGSDETDRTISAPRSPRPAFVAGDASLPLPLSRSTSARRTGAARSAAILERGRDQGLDPRLCRARDDARRSVLRPGRQRIATFDNDGTLWVEQPMYVQLAFALDRVKAHRAACIRNGRPSNRSRRCSKAI